MEQSTWIMLKGVPSTLMARSQLDDDALAHGECQLAQRVADSQHGVAHVDVGALAQRHGLQAGGVDLQHRHIVVAVAADDGGIVGVAVVQRHLHSSLARR